MNLKQKTIKSEFTLEGVGLHTGRSVVMRALPAMENTGIRFVRTDLPGRPVIAAVPENVRVDTSVPRCTSLGLGEHYIHTVEHFMSALCGAGITNLTIEINNIELPGMDGSAADFLKAIDDAGVEEQNAAITPFVVYEPIVVELKGCSILIVPSQEFRVSYTLDYSDTFLKSQFYSVGVTEDVFRKEIARCRTFCLEKEVQELKNLGLGQGANYQNTIVVGEKGVVGNQLRFPDECARHKVLDFIGDLYLLGVPLRGHVYAVKSGHTLNFLLLKKILRHKLRMEEYRPIKSFQWDGRPEINIRQVMSILPHRYPFLLVDRVVEIEKGKKAVGIKNVTINDGFFQGHFPTRPVMPGVLMVEAMAQTAGVVVLTNEEHHGKLAFFMAVDNVKFRRVVEPGDQLVMHVEVIRDRSRTAQVRAKAMVDDEIAAEADMVFSFTEGGYLNP